jgi:hypothetical protein
MGISFKFSVFSFQGRQEDASAFARKLRRTRRMEVQISDLKTEIETRDEYEPPRHKATKNRI